jgi:hypothetical protein
VYVTAADAKQGMMRWKRGHLRTPNKRIDDSGVRPR